MRTTRSAPQRDRRGFTILELVIVLTIAGILVGIAVPQMRTAFHQREVTGARDNVILLSARARAMAMEQAETIRFRLDASAGIAEIIDDGATVERYRFESEHGVAASAEIEEVVLCYTPRGYATRPCSTTLSTPLQVEFSRSGQSARLEIWQLGQVRKS